MNRDSRFRRYVLPTVASLALGACAPGTEPDATVRSAPQDLYSDPRVALWPNGVVPVCFETGTALDDGSGDPNAASAHPNFANLRRAIRDAVDNGWGRVANIRFTGWGDCPSRRSTENGGRVAIHWEYINALALIGHDPGSWTRMRLNPNDLDPAQGGNEALFRAVVLHEFGHALGFFHEFDRPDNRTPEGEDCTGGGGTSGAYYGTPFDPDSIMTFSYCRAGTHPAVLSAWDIVGVQRAYGRKLPGALVGEGNRCLSVPLPVRGYNAGLVASACTGGPEQVFARTGGQQLFTPGGWFSPIPYNLFVDVPGASTTPGTQVQTYTGSNPPSANQQWRFERVTIRGIGDKCLDVAGAQARAGAAVQLYDCHGGANQRWTVSPSGEIRSALGDGNLCLDVPWGSAQAGNRLQLYPCHGGASQRFATTPRGELTYGGLCLDVATGTVANGNPVQLYNCQNGLNQLWHLRGPVLGIGGRCLDIRGGAGSGDGAAAQIYTCHGGANQEWDYYFR